MLHCLRIFPRAYVLSGVFALLVSSIFLPAFAEDAPPAAPSKQTGGAGDLLVTPTRVVLEGRKRADEVILNNRGTKESTYRISLKHMSMDENGRYQELDAKTAATAQAGFADEIIRFSPRQVTLKPGESQTVKIMLRKPEGLAEGEYRSHMLFQAVPDASFGADVEEKPADADKISVQLIPLIGVSIPIIVRNGELQAQARLTHAALNNKQLNVTVERSGNKSLYGDFMVMQGQDVLAQMRGLAVYTPNTRRMVSLELSPAPRKDPLHIVFRAREEDGGTILAETELNP